MAFTKDTAIELLKNGEISRFNDERPYSETELFNLSEIDFSEINIIGANLSYTDLNDTNFTDSELKEVNFSNSDLTSAIFLRADISEVDFTGANLNGVNFASTTCKANFTDADLSGADFSDGDFSESDFGLSVNMSLCKFDSYTVWPDSSELPDEFDPEYIKDDLEDEEDVNIPKSDGYY